MRFCFYPEAETILVKKRKERVERLSPPCLVLMSGARHRSPDEIVLTAHVEILTSTRSNFEQRLKRASGVRE